MCLKLKCLIVLADDFMKCPSSVLGTRRDVLSRGMNRKIRHTICVYIRKLRYGVVLLRTRSFPHTNSRIFRGTVKHVMIFRESIESHSRHSFLVSLQCCYCFVCGLVEQSNRSARVTQHNGVLIRSVKIDTC